MTETPDLGLTRRSLLRAAATLGAGATLATIGCGRWAAGRSDPRGVGGATLSRLRDSLDGTLILPADAGYDPARRVASFNPRTDKRPALIVRCATAADVALSLDYARSNGLEVAVRGGGHDVLGESVCEGGALIDLGRMNAIEVSPARGLARVEAGVRAGQVNEALQGHGLAAALGCHPGVGVAGLTLGGGLGWLMGRFGASCDNLVSVELVTADGSQLRASEDEHPELFWGLRGGGGNFGVATAFEYRLHPVDRVVGGYLVYPGARAKDFLRAFRDTMAKAPDGLAVEVNVFASSEPPAYPPILVAAACYSGDLGQADRALAPFRALGATLVDSVQETPYARLTDLPPELERLAGIDPPDEAPEPSEPAATASGSNYWQGANLSRWTDAAIDTFIGRAATAPPGWSIGFGHYMHGEVCRGAAPDTAIPRREGSTSYFYNIGWGGEERAEAAMAWVDESMAAMRPYSDEATYVNYLSSDAEAAVAAAYGENYRRLQALKAKLDPDNVFHLNRNVRPTA